MKREKILLVKVTEEEKKKISEKAKEEGLTVSAYMRYHSLKGGK